MENVIKLNTPAMTNSAIKIPRQFRLSGEMATSSCKAQTKTRRYNNKQLNINKNNSQFISTINLLSHEVLCFLIGFSFLSLPSWGYKNLMGAIKSSSLCLYLFRFMNNAIP